MLFKTPLEASQIDSVLCFSSNWSHPTGVHLQPAVNKRASQLLRLSVNYTLNFITWPCYVLFLVILIQGYSPRTSLPLCLLNDGIFLLPSLASFLSSKDTPSCGAWDRANSNKNSCRLVSEYFSGGLYRYHPSEYPQQPHEGDVMITPITDENWGAPSSPVPQDSPLQH